MDRGGNEDGHSLNSELSPYLYKAARDHPSENDRLDALHNAITEYFGLLPVDPSVLHPSPSSILDIGSGSGAWATHAAELFPSATVVALDINPLPERSFPNNISFVKHDVARTFPFHKENFDIIHARLTLLHVPNGKDVLLRAIELLKPGGWLLVEEPNNESCLDGGGPLGPGMQHYLKLAHQIMRERGANPFIAKDIEAIVKSTEVFSEINVQKITVPISEKCEDPLLNKFGLAWKMTAIRAASDMPDSAAALGFTKEVIQNYIAELTDPDRNINVDVYFTWSRKKSA